MKVKTKSKPMSSSMQMKNVLSNRQANEKHQTLNSQPITGSQPTPTHSTPKVRENENANKSQEMKVKLPRARKT
jgi:hypothetical protein